MSPSQRDDYVLRQTRAIAAMIARMMGLRLEGEPEKARVELEQAYGSLLGPQAELIRRVDASTAIRLIASRENVEAFAQLLEEESEQATDEKQSAFLRGRAAEFRKALRQKSGGSE